VSRYIQEAEAHATKDIHDKVFLDGVVYSILVNACANAGKPIKAENALCKMQSLLQTAWSLHISKRSKVIVFLGRLGCA
jgi:pentatricopeptide repeat protein